MPKLQQDFSSVPFYRSTDSFGIASDCLLLVCDRLSITRAGHTSREGPSEVLVALNATTQRIYRLPPWKSCHTILLISHLITAHRPSHHCPSAISSLPIGYLITAPIGHHTTAHRPPYHCPVAILSLSIMSQRFAA